MIVILTAGTMLIFSVSFQFFRMLPEGAPHTGVHPRLLLGTARAELGRQNMAVVRNADVIRTGLLFPFTCVQADRKERRKTLLPRNHWCDHFLRPVVESPAWHRTGTRVILTGYGRV